MTKLWIDICGWIGSIVILAAYFGISTGRLKSAAVSYQLLNVAGSVLLIINTVFYGAYPSSFVNIVWAGIGVMAMLHKQKVDA
jgi:hypothetical protein